MARRIPILFVLSLVLTVSVEAGSESPKQENRLLQVGERISTNEAATGERWLGLFKSDGRYTLRYTKIKVYAVEGLEDKPDGPFTSKGLATPGEKTSPLFLVKGPSFHASTTIRTSFDGSIQFAAGTFACLGDGEERLCFGAEGRPFDGYADHIKEYSLVVWRGNVAGPRQVLIPPCEAYEFPSLTWVGDLDGDNHLDFLLSPFTSGAGSGEQCLYLSTAAEGDELVHKVDCVAYDGC